MYALGAYIYKPFKEFFLWECKKAVHFFLYFFQFFLKSFLKWMINMCPKRIH